MLLSTGLAVPCQHFWDGSRTSRKVELESRVLFPDHKEPMGHSIIQLKVIDSEYIWNFFRGPLAHLRKLRLAFHLLACVTSTFVFSGSSQCRHTVWVAIRHSLTEASGYHHASSNDVLPIWSLFSYPLPPSILLFDPRIPGPPIYPSIRPFVFDLCLRLWSCPTGADLRPGPYSLSAASSKAEWLSPTALVCCELWLTFLDSLSYFSTLSLLSQKSPPK